MSPRHYLVVISPQVGITIIVVHLKGVTIIHYLAPVPPNKPVRPRLLAPSTVLIPWAFHFSMPWLLFATFGANWWSPVRAIEQGYPVKEGHLTQLLDFLANLHLNLYLYLGRFTVGATCLLVLPVTTYGAGPPLLLRAFLRLMAPLPATEAFDLAGMTIHEDRQFYRSVSTGNEW